MKTGVLWLAAALMAVALEVRGSDHLVIAEFGAGIIFEDHVRKLLSSN